MPIESDEVLALATAFLNANSTTPDCEATAVEPTNDGHINIHFDYTHGNSEWEIHTTELIAFAWSNPK